MPHANRQIEAKLKNKFGFQPIKEDADHRWLALELPGVPPVRTRISHGRQTVGQDLEHWMARQLRVTAPYFREMIRCTKDRDDYYNLLSTGPS